MQQRQCPPPRVACECSVRMTGPFPAPDTFRHEGRDAVDFLSNLDSTIAAMREAGRPPAALILDSSFSSDGIFFPEPRLLAAAAGMIRAAGGLFIADEVQSGFGRLGASMWGFARYGAEPDIISMGKPMGDGHPVAGLLVRPDLVEGFGAAEGYFNTFGGNPVAAAVALAVLDVIDHEELIARAGRVGDYLRRELQSLARVHSAVADVRVMGLYCGLEIAADDEPDRARRRTRTIINEMRRRRVLLGGCGPCGNVLKIRPPLPFSEANADHLVEALDAVLRSSDV